MGIIHQAVLPNKTRGKKRVDDRRRGLTAFFYSFAPDSLGLIYGAIRYRHGLQPLQPWSYPGHGTGIMGWLIR